MKFTCNSLDLNNAVSKVQGTVESSTTIPALKGILITAPENSGEVTLTGYNLETGIKTSIIASIISGGSIILDARRINDICRSLPASTVTISVDEKNNCSITSGDASFSIIGMSATEYPDLPEIKDGYTFSYSRQLLKSMIRQTRYAVAKTDIKPVHKGICFEIKDGYIKLVAVDGYRLAIRSESNIKNIEDIKFIVPEKALSELIKLYSDEPGEINISVGEKHIVFEIEGFTVISRLLEGDFIDYRTVVPKNVTTKVRTETKKLIECIERTSLLIDDRVKCPIRLIFEENEMKCSCVTTLGNANDKIPLNVEGERIEIGFNNAYLVDALKACECEEIYLEFSGPLSPLKVTPVTGEEFIFLILPVRLSAQR